MTSLRDMNERMQQWMQEKPTFDNGNELRLNKDDVAIFRFASNGNDGDTLIKVYRTHIVEAISKKGKPYNTHRYCPVQSGDDTPCPLCDQGIKNIKERMSIWMWVTDIMHASLPQDKQFPMVDYEGRRYYHEEVNGWRVWHTSAWRDSCWPDINKLYQIYSGLHNFTAQLVCTGANLDRRYKPFALPNSPSVSPEEYARAKEECEPIPEILKKQLASPVQQNPGPNDQGSSYYPPQQQPQNVTPFTPFGGGQPSNPSSPPWEAPSQQPAARPEGNKLVEVPASTPEADQRRPLKSLF